MEQRMLRRRVDSEEMNPSHASTHNSVLNSVWFRPNLMLVLLSSSLGESQRNAPFFSTSFFFFLCLGRNGLVYSLES